MVELNSNTPNNCMALVFNELSTEPTLQLFFTLRPRFLSLFLKSEAEVQFQDHPCGICGRLIGIGDRWLFKVI